MNVLMWFRRDLRVGDHPALARAAALGRVLPLYIVEPDYWRRPETSARQWEFLAESLDDLRRQLDALGVPLVVRSGDAVEVLARLTRAHRIGRMVSLRDRGCDWSLARDARVAGWARGQGLLWEDLPDTPPGDLLEEGPPAITPVPGLEPGLIPPARSLGLASDPCPHRQRGGRAHGLTLIAGYAARRGAGDALSPAGDGRGGARLSPYLAHGLVSPADLPAEVAQGMRAGLDWRAQCHAAMRARPGLERAPLSMRASGDDTHLAAFARAETGLPFADACLRALRASGWLNPRGRRMLAGFAVHLLGLDWRLAGQALARLFTDYDPAIHWPQMQHVAGAGGLRAAQVVRLGQTHDPEGRFLRRWLPELAPVPVPHLHAPWRWSGAGRVLGRAYPEPVVDPALATREARDRLLPKPRPRAAPPARGEVILTEGPSFPRPLRETGAQLCLDL